MTTSEIISRLPFQEPFLFVDGLEAVDESNCLGYYTIKEDEYFFKGHFPENPVVPGTIITEIMAQIGLVCHAIFLSEFEGSRTKAQPAFTRANVEFLLGVGPGDRLTVESEKVYFRLNKLKSKISCRNQKGELVCKGEFAGMIVNQQ